MNEPNTEQKENLEEILESSEDMTGEDHQKNNGAENEDGSTWNTEAQQSEADPEQEMWRDRYIRLASEFDNFKKRTHREKDQLIKYGNEQLLKTFMSLLDDLQRAIKAAETAQELSSVQEGLAMVYRNFLQALDRQGVQMIEAIGEVFDSNLHEAIASLPAPEPGQKGRVIDEVEKGYLYQGKVIRYAKVIVGE